MKDLQAARNLRRRELGQQLVAGRSVVDILTQPQPAPVTDRSVAKAGPQPVRFKLYREDWLAKFPEGTADDRATPVPTTTPRRRRR